MIGGLSERTASRACHGQDRCHGDRAGPAITGFVRRMNNASTLASQRPIVRRKEGEVNRAHCFGIIRLYRSLVLVYDAANTCMYTRLRVED